MKLKKIQKILVFLLAGFVLIFLLDRFILSAFRDRLKILNEEIKLSELKLKNALLIQKQKDKIIKEYKDYSTYLKVETRDRDIIADFLKEIEKISRDSGASIVNLNPKNQPEENKGYKKFKTDLRLDASMEQLFIFLDNIQRSGLLIAIDKISLSPKDEKASIFRIEMVMSIAVPMG